MRRQRVFRRLDLGRRAYAPALALQERLLRRVADGTARPALLLVEHDPPVITLGRRAGDRDVLVGPDELARRGVELHRAARGGAATWHGPGQLVAYPILPLRAWGLGLRAYQRRLEETVLQLLRRLGAAGERVEGRTGVWAVGGKIASIGVAARRWVSYHGVALNVTTDPEAFGLIVPCGEPDGRVTSLRRLGVTASVDDVKPAFVEAFCHAFAAKEKGDRLLSRDRRRRSGIPARHQPRAIGRRRSSLSPFSWLRKRLPPPAETRRVRGVLGRLGLNTVCNAAHCPNRAECFRAGTATFMVLGGVCTRSCRFCAVASGRPEAVRADEPEAVAAAAAELGLRHVVVTSVTRDDLADGGAGHFARTVAAGRRRRPSAAVEVLTPDFLGGAESVDAVLDAAPDVFNHNIETVRRLSRMVRPQADYDRSLGVLARAAGRAPAAGRPRVKSGLMLGLGETDAEVREALADLRAAGCDVLTLGQYLAPSPDHAPVRRFVAPGAFEALRQDALGMGFAAVAAGPFVRSSYHAGEVFREVGGRRGQGVTASAAARGLPGTR